MAIATTNERDQVAIVYPFSTLKLVLIMLYVESYHENTSNIISH